MSLQPELNEYQLAILGYIARHKKKHQRIIDEFQTKSLPKSAIKSILRSLLQYGYIKEVDINVSPVQVVDLNGPNTPPETEKGYKITELGKYRIGTSNANNGISIGNNVNFALNSPGVRQSIDIAEYKEDVQIKISEMQEAVVSNDKLKFLKTLGYVLDKGVDVAIALALAHAGVSR